MNTPDRPDDTRNSAAAGGGRPVGPGTRPPGPDATAEDFVALGERLGLHGTNYVVGWTAWLDLAPVGVDKASGLEHVADKLGVAAQDVLAIGDGRNDIEMLQWAGRGVAMGQAIEEVRAAADGVTSSVFEDGAAVEIGKYFP